MLILKDVFLNSNINSFAEIDGILNLFDVLDFRINEVSTG